MSDETIAKMRENLKANGLLQQDFELAEALQVIEIDIEVLHNMLEEERALRAEIEDVRNQLRGRNTLEIANEQERKWLEFGKKLAEEAPDHCKFETGGRVYSVAEAFVRYLRTMWETSGKP